MVVDLRSVMFLSAAGLTVLARTSRGCLTDAVELRVVACHSAVTRPPTVTGLDQCVGLCSSADGADT